MFGAQNKDLAHHAELFKKGVILLFKERGELEFSSPPELIHKQIIEFGGKIRADGIDKFNNEVTYVSAVNFYANQADMEKRKTLGALITYVEKDYLATLMKRLQYPPIDDDNEQALLDSIGTLCNIVSGRFKSEIKAAGYTDLEMSHFINYRNSAVAGIDFCPKEYYYYELNCEIDGVRRLIIDMTMGMIPKR